MPDEMDYDQPCPGCSRPVGDHTIRGWGDCLKASGFDYELPLEDIPGGPLNFRNVEGAVVGEVTVAPGLADTAIGRVPILRFVFTGAGAEPMSRRSLPPITLMMDSNGLRSFRRLVSASVDRAIVAARHGR